jgi:F-type H+-transporting ATPase subunit b
VLIDWFTVVAQILNFLILVALLKYFLYDRIIRAMDQRKEKIRSRLEEAERQAQQAKEEKDTYQRKSREIDAKEHEFLSEAKKKADDKKKELTQKAKKEVEELRTRWKYSLQKEKESSLRDLQQALAKEVYTVARRAMKDLADTGVDQRATEVFLDRIRNLKPETRSKVLEALRDSDYHASVRSSFEIPSELRENISSTLQEELETDLALEFETKPEIGFGIELRTQGWKIAWHAEDYLAALEEETLESLSRYTTEGLDAAT